MFPKPSDPDTLQPQELKAVYAISRVVAQTDDTFNALNQIIRLVRPVFIFDNIVLYQKNESRIEPIYARAIGRGRSAEADLTWGEVIAKEVYDSGETVNRKEELPGAEKDRLLIRFFLGLPLRAQGQILGVLVFIRFGSPPYTSDQEYLAQFISEHITHLVERENLIAKISSLEAERKLAQLQDDFIATVSHDLRSPLGFIKGYATTLLREDANWDGTTRQEFLSVIDEEADRLSDLIDNLLDSSRLQAGTLRMDFQSVRLDSLLMEIVQRAEVAEYDIDIQLKMLAPSVRINADPTRLVQVFDNLLSNAAKYATGTVVEISYQIEDRRAHITVRDHGEGIAQEHIENIFKRFYRIQDSNRSGRGSGLGLYICRQIINSHKGEIYATSEIGEGAIFHILLPIER